MQYFFISILFFGMVAPIGAAEEHYEPQKYSQQREQPPSRNKNNPPPRRNDDRRPRTNDANEERAEEGYIQRDPTFIG